MTLRIYNTLTRTKEVFTPIDPKNVRMYVCGPTVYDYAHIGNARPAIVFDVLCRLLRHTYGADHVTYVRNITDVDDKINARALRDFPDTPLNDAIRRVTEKTYDQYQKDVAALGCLPPTAQPRATEHIAGMIKMIQVLLDRKFAYVIQGEEGREALFDVKQMKEYGALSGRKLDEQKAGARVAVEQHKRNPGDFVLWKESNASEPGWDATFELSEENQNELKLNSRSVMIFGRPGWHIECSVMAKAHLGEVFDIHGGGLDLIFPHHENEIAQSRCANGTHGTDVMANYWMHNGFLQVEGQKMSKSLGNFVTIADVLKNWPGDVVKLNMLRTHYTQPIDWTTKSLEETRRMLVSMGNAIRDHLPSEKPDSKIIEYLEDDLNTAGVFKRLNELLVGASKNPDAARSLRMTLEFLGLFRNFTLNLSITYSADQLNSNPLGVVKGLITANGDYDLEFIARHFEGKYGTQAEATTSLLRKFEKGTLIRDVRPLATKLDQIVSLDTANVNARAAKNYAIADEIKNKLAAENIVIKINKDGTTTWEVKR